MDNSKYSQQNDPLGVNKIGKSIKKSPFHQPNFVNHSDRPQPQPQVYNISKNDFRNIVQQLTGCTSRESLPRPSQDPPKPQNMRLQNIRPPPLTPVNRPEVAAPVPDPAPAPSLAPVNNNFVRPGQFGHSSTTILPSVAPRDPAWAKTVESPVSAYMRHLQNSIMDPGLKGNQGPGYFQPRPPPSSSSFPSPHNGPTLLPSPTTQLLLPSPTGYLNIWSPRSSNLLFSPTQFPPPLSPNFAFSPMAQSGILASGFQTPHSPGFTFPLSPTGLSPLSSPLWRDQYSRK